MNKLILEEIQRMNLLSKYDTSKTLSEQQWKPSDPKERYLSSFSPTGQSNTQPAATPTATTPAATTPAATTPTASTAPPSANKANWDNVVKYYEGNKDPNWKFDKMEKFEDDNGVLNWLVVDSTDSNDDDSFMRIWDDGEVNINNKGKGTGGSKGTWEWDGTKPVIKFKDISKNASGYVQSTDTDWSAVTEDNKVIGLYAQGLLVKKIQNNLINIGYSGTTSGSITTDVEACKGDVEKCDGIYGKVTKAMVKQYQKDNGLAVDGIVGKQTFTAMFTGFGR